MTLHRRWGDVVFKLCACWVRTENINEDIEQFHTFGRFSVKSKKRDKLLHPIYVPIHQAPSEKDLSLKGKNMLPLGANLFLLD